MSARKLAVVILAAGHGTRMKSSRPKVMHEVAGQAMLQHVINGVKSLDPVRVVVLVGPGYDDVRALAERNGCDVVVQEERLGTGHAAKIGLSVLGDLTVESADADIMVAIGDTPLIRPETYAELYRIRSEAASPALGFLCFRPQDPAKYGRVKLDEAGQAVGIVEFADASEEERRIDLCNGGIVLCDAPKLRVLLDNLSNDNAQGEYYLTDIMADAYQRGWGTAVAVTTEEQVMGVNSRLELSRAEAIMQDRLREEAMLSGVTLIDPSSTWLSADTEWGQDIVVEPGVWIGSGVSIADGARIRTHSHLEGASVGPDAVVGPYARLRPGAELGSGVKVGNFVEVKNAQLDEGAKVNHLSYVGDASVGAKANIGAGTITCNYDGFFKYRTEIGAGAFIGSNSALVAPVSIGEGAIVGAGSTVTKSVADNDLAVVRGKLINSADGASRFRAIREDRKNAEKK
ncbi:bifunctional UDP-N-acetylglucosamine diphosphorylase/glucosamine-1-phosphate N-acetyltransferase GlmU [Kiloniella sp. b19]|uniref:bifunctional UDP-N-acetylglucosamine diphosphorylase/glucosamine-1-phosphate N-acetyltransferase GlmU n=1 Tax=Kiloniella sp. GXU_MW_B19 TaxID=3141326 RepID=UPI0031D56897